MKDVELDDLTVSQLRNGMADAQGERPMTDLMAERDALIVGMLCTTKGIRR